MTTKDYVILTDAQIIEIRQRTRTTDTTPWADTLAFAKGLIAEIERLERKTK